MRIEARTGELTDIPDSFAVLGECTRVGGSSNCHSGNPARYSCSTKRLSGKLQEIYAMVHAALHIVQDTNNLQRGASQCESHTLHVHELHA